MSNDSREFFVGVDIGDKSNKVAVLRRDSEDPEQDSVNNTISAMNEFFDRFEEPSKVRVAIETGTHSPWVSEILRVRGFEVLVGNARKLRMIWGQDTKDDVRDAEMLARICRFDPKLLSPITHRSRAAQMDLAVLKARDLLVRNRTSMIQFVRSIVKSAGERLPACSSPAFAREVAEHIPKDLVPATVPCLNMIEEMNKEIRHLDTHIATLCTQVYSEETEVLRQIDGVGPITSLAFVLTLEEPSRFAKSRDVGAFLGLTPKRDQSGQTDKPLSITKAGNIFLRRLLVGSATYMLGPFGPDCELRRYGERIASRGGKVSKRKATVAVARKLAVLMHHVWKNHGTYDPFYHANVKKLSHAA
jgi:transposase